MTVSASKSDLLISCALQTIVAQIHKKKKYDFEYNDFFVYLVFKFDTEIKTNQKNLWKPIKNHLFQNFY